MKKLRKRFKKGDQVRMTMDAWRTLPPAISSLNDCDDIGEVVDTWESFDRREPDTVMVRFLRSGMPVGFEPDQLEHRSDMRKHTVTFKRDDRVRLYKHD